MQMPRSESSKNTDDLLAPLEMDCFWVVVERLRELGQVAQLCATCSWVLLFLQLSHV